MKFRTKRRDGQKVGQKMKLQIITDKRKDDKE